MWAGMGQTRQRGRMARRALLGAIGAMVCGVGICAAPIVVQADTPYVDPLNRFALSVPDGWTPQRQTVPEILGIWTADDGAASFTVVYTPVDSGSTGDDLASAYQPLLASLPGYTDTDRRIVPVAGQDATLLDYFVTEASGRVVRVQQVFVTQGGDGFVLSFRCASADAPKYAMAVGGMVGSFTFGTT